MQTTIRQPTLMQRIRTWAGDRVATAIWGGRMRMAPERETMAYSRLLSIGGTGHMPNRPLIKPTPATLRRFARTVYARRAINRIKTPVAALKWEVRPKQGVTLTSELQRQIDIVRNCLTRPNNDDSFTTLAEQVVEDYLICGAGVIEHEIGGNQIRPLWMWPVDALSIQIYPGWSGDKNDPRYFQALGYGSNVGGVGGIPLTNDALIYIRRDPTTDNPFGLGALEVAFNSISRQLGVADYAGNLAANAQPANIIVFKNAPTAEIERLRSFWRTEVEGQGVLPFIGADGAEVHPIRGTTDDALFLKYQEFIVREIAAAFCISPSSIGLEQHDNRATAEVAEDRDWSNAIIPTASAIAAHINRESIDGKLGFSQIEFAFLGLDREDESLLADIHEAYYKINVLTPNEIREKIGLEPLESEWADMAFADTQIAMASARGAAQVFDADLERKNPEESGEKEPDYEGGDDNVSPKQQKRRGMRQQKGPA